MWQAGETIVRREVRNDGWCWLEVAVRVVRDDRELLATYIPRGAELAFPPGPEAHPWSTRDRWEGHGVLMLQRPGEACAVWVFWEGPERRHACWYVNLQEPFRRRSDGYETQDLELDLIVHPDGRCERKDEELLEQRVREGRFTEDQLRDIRAEGFRIETELAAGRRWWDPYWALWEPDPAWDRATLVRAAAER